MPDSEFFEDRKPAAVLKHGLLAQYAYYFAGRAGKAAKGQVAFVDGYAGSGRYEDGSPGSPLLLVSRAQMASLIDREVDVTYVERDPAIAQRLTKTLEDAGISDPNILFGDFSELLPEIRETVRGRATLYFVDPFGLALNFDEVVRMLKDSKPLQPVDIIYHFSSASIARMASRVVKADLGDALGDMPDNLDAALGPDVDWKSSFAAIPHDVTGEAYPLAVELSREFAESVVAAVPNTDATVIEIKPQPDHATIYTLVLFSRDKKAHWDYCDQAGRAYVDWLERCSNDEYESNLATAEASGMVPLFPSPAPDREDLEERLESEAVRYLVDRIHKLLMDGPRRFIDNPTELYGDYLGRAREKHVRTAVKQLYKDGLIADNGVKAFWLRPISLVAR